MPSTSWAWGARVGVNSSTLRRHIRQHRSGHPLTDLTRLLRILVERFILVVHRNALLFRHLDLDRANRQVRVCPGHDRWVAGNIGEVEVRKAISEAGATSAKDMGNVMKIIMPRVKGRADGKQVNEVIKAQLG